MLTVSPKRKKSSNGITSSSIRTRQEQESKSPVIWLVVGGIILLFGIGAWIWLGRSPETEIPAPTATTPLPPPVAAPDSVPAAVEPPNVTEPEPEDEEPVAQKPDAASKKAPTTGTVARKDAKPLPPPPPPPPPEPDPADKKTEKVFLTSRPSGAKVVLDGRGVGKTPVEVEIKGKGHLTLTLDGYKPLEKEVRVAEVRGTLNLELQASEQAPAVAASSEPMGKFFLSSSPAGAEIRYQGKLIGKTPRMVELPVGSRKLDLQSGALQKSVDVELKEGQNPAQHIPL